MNISIQNRLLGLLAVAALGLTLMIAFSVWSSRAIILGDTQQALKEQTQAALSIMDRYAEMVEKGTLSEEEAKQAAFTAVSAIRFGTSGYFFVQDMDNVMVMHGAAPQLVGKDMSGTKDKTGDLFVKRMNDMVRDNGEGFVRYYWGKPGEPKDAVFPKEAFVQRFAPWDLMVGTGVYIDDLNSRIWSAVLPMAIASLLLIPVMAALFFFIARSISRPLSRIQANMMRLADGEMEIKIDAGRMPPELRAMNNTVEVFRNNAVDRQRLQEREGADQATQRQRQERIDGLIGEFRDGSEATLASVNSLMEQMESAARALAGVSDSASQKATGVAAASEEASTNVQTVASAAEELAASISEITGQVGRTTEIVGEATAGTKDASQKVSALVEAAQKIGDVVSLISEIAEQTNLLALNATIEAARAGEMGKGFAVVASEVKSLANQTAKATEEISTQVTFVQESTQDAVKAIEEIAKTMEGVDSYTAAIADAVEQQGAATNEISHNVNEAASGTQSVAENIAGVMSAVSETSASSELVANTSRDAAAQVDALRKAVHKFLSDVAAA